ncbi:hypothetical protein [Microbacterium sp. 69-7]|uniref:hypothetical protein n=1 Tax=Microbacterium sp. 69-7 TaxID=1895784 RepID=UPI000A543F71|nr:hypothetical protein [Microbacterium sp. 69-7]
MIRWSRVILLAASVVVLSGCAASTIPAPTTAAPTRSVSPQASSSVATPSATTSPSAVVVNIPNSCDALATVDAVSAAMGKTWVAASQEPTLESIIPGPQARSAATEATAKLQCLWWPELATEAYVALGVYRLSDSAATSLLSSLRSTPEYNSVDPGIPGAVAFSYEDRGGEFLTSTVYVFVGDSWFAGGSLGPAARIVPLVLDAAKRSIG